jgi:hypothetical protein
MEPEFLEAIEIGSDREIARENAHAIRTISVIFVYSNEPNWPNETMVCHGTELIGLS